MGTRVMNDYSYPEGQYSPQRPIERLGERENVSGYELPKKESSQNGMCVLLFGPLLLPKDVSKGSNPSVYASSTGQMLLRRMSLLF